MGRLPNKLKQNPKLIQREMSDGRASLWLEYYLGRSETPVYDDDGNPVIYDSGAMKGTPKYKVKHLRKKEALNLYIWLHPRTADERKQNKNTLQLAESIRFEREQELLEDRNGYRLKKEKERNFLRYLQQHIDNEGFTMPSRKSYRYSLKRLREFIELMPQYQKFKDVLPMDAITPNFVIGFVNYLRKVCVGEGARKNYFWFKKAVANAVEEEIIKKNPCNGIRIVYETNVVKKEILTPKEIDRLAAFRYDGEHREVQRAFIFCCYTGLRYCDVSELTYANVDFESRVMRFNQKKAEGRSAHAGVVIPLSDGLLKLIGTPKDGDTSQKIFVLPEKSAAARHLTRWVKLAGINKHITWHCARHSVAVNLLNSGTDIKTTSSILGHSSIKMTEKYLHVIDSRKVKAIDKLGSVDFEIDENPPAKRKRYQAPKPEGATRKKASTEKKATSATGRKRGRPKKNPAIPQNGEEIAI